MPAGEIKPPADAKNADAQLPATIAALAAKATDQGWDALSAREKHQLATHDPELAARLKRGR